MCGRAEPVESDVFAGLHARDAQGPKSDDAGTQERRRMQIVEPFVQRMRKIGARHNGLNVTPIDIVPREDRGVAEILASFEAKPARTVRAASHDIPTRVPISVVTSAARAATIPTI
jgi:hypothetical protein